MLHEQLTDLEADKVVGGTVFLNEQRMLIGFTKLKERYQLKNCTYADAWGLIDTLHGQNPDLENKEFDQLVKDTFVNNGWIVLPPVEEGK